VTSKPDERGVPTGRICPQDALKRRVVGVEDKDDPNNNYYEYAIDEARCDGCGKCVKACLPPAGNGSLRSRSATTGVSSATSAPSSCLPRPRHRPADVPGVAPSRTISGSRSEQESPDRVAALRRRDAGVECARCAVPEGAAGFRRGVLIPDADAPRTAQHLGPRLDVAMLSAGLGLGAWLILKRRTRNGVMLLSVGTIAYFGFYRKGCICPIGAIQN